MPEDVLTAVAAVVTCFQSSAGLIHSVSLAREQRRQKKRRRKDADREDAAHERLLHTALLTGARECHDASVERHHQHGPAFGNGDATAVSELKDIVISLQAEVIRSLQSARDVQNASLDLTRLHEAAVANRLRAIRALDGLCERIVSRLEPVSSVDLYSTSPAYARTAGISRTHSRTISAPSYSYTLSSISPPSISPTYQVVDYFGQHSPNGFRALYRSSSDRTVSRSSSSSSSTSAYSWSSVPPRRRRADTDDLSLSDLSIHEKDAVESQITPMIPPVELSALPKERSIPPAASRHWHSASMGQMASGKTLGFNMVSPITEEEEPNSAFPEDDDDQGYASPDSSMAFGSPDSLSFPTSGTPGTSSLESNAYFLPNAIRPDLPQTWGDAQSPAAMNTKYPPRLTTIHPAMRNLYLENPVALSPEPDHAWEPLARPAKHNNYHNFCKGAWQTRRSIREGLIVSQSEDAKGNPLPYWKCKHCQFAAVSSAEDIDLPNRIFTHLRTGIRYRWAFLAHSHLPAAKSLLRSSSYRYGCILCAAQGRETDIFEHLDSLMTHFTSKHKTQLLTPEVLNKTQCVVGDEAEHSLTWNLCLPVSIDRKQGGVGGFMAAAVGGFAARNSSRENLRQ